MLMGWQEHRVEGAAAGCTCCATAVAVSVSTSPASSAEAITAPPPMRMTSRSVPPAADAASARSRAACADLACAVAGVVVPALWSVDDVEEAAAEDDGARAGGSLAQDPAVVGIVGERPGVQGLAARAQTAGRAGVGPGDEAVEETEMSAMMRVMPGRRGAAPELMVPACAASVPARRRRDAQ
jgi:hypothetical protein